MSVRRYATLSVVLVGGTLTALPFYKHPSAALPSAEVASPTSPAEAAASQSGSPSAIKPPSIAVEAVPADFVGPVGGVIDSPDSANPAAATSEWLRPTPFVLSSEHESLPALAQLPTFRTASKNRSGATILEPDFTRSSSATESDVADARTQTTLSGRTVRKTVPMRRHRIVDGDALPSIALRYLGDERRYPEIIALNSDLLRDPSLLPVGKTLLIPSSDPSVSRPSE